MSTSPRSIRLRALLLFLVIFVAGSVMGSAVTFGVGSRVLQRRNNAAVWKTAALERFDRRLNLTPEQRAKFEPILTESSRRMRTARIESLRRWSLILEDTRHQLRAELTPAQQKEFDRMVVRTREQMRRAGMGGPEARE